MSDRSFSGEELRNEVIHRSNLGESERRIAKQLGLSRWKVTKIIRQNRKSRSVQELNLESSSQSPNLSDTIPASLGPPVQKRASKLDAFEPQLQQLLQRYPRITVIRLQEELQGVGYTGGYSILTERVRELRARPAKPLTVQAADGPLRNRSWCAGSDGLVDLRDRLYARGASQGSAFQLHSWLLAQTVHSFYSATRLRNNDPPTYRSVQASWRCRCDVSL